MTRLVWDRLANGHYRTQDGKYRVFKAGVKEWLASYYAPDGIKSLGPPRTTVAEAKQACVQHFNRQQRAMP